jgi:plasmid stability protein
VRRTQLYLDDDLWKMLHERARAQGTTISALVRDAVRQQYPNLEERRKAMEAVVGMRRERFANVDAIEYINQLRDDRRSRRIRQSSPRER